MYINYKFIEQQYFIGWGWIVLYLFTLWRNVWQGHRPDLVSHSWSWGIRQGIQARDGEVFWMNNVSIYKDLVKRNTVKYSMMYNKKIHCCFHTCFHSLLTSPKRDTTSVDLQQNLLLQLISISKIEAQSQFQAKQYYSDDWRCVTKAHTKVWSDYIRAPCH